MENANYAVVNPGPTVWGVTHKTTKELLETSDNLKELRRKFAGDDYVFSKIENAKNGS